MSADLVERVAVGSAEGTSAAVAVFAETAGVLGTAEVWAALHPD